MSTEHSRITLKVIAEQCGYSINTVSRALRGDNKLPEQTVFKIQSVAEELGYIRNNFASSLRSGHSNLIAIIVDDILNQHYSLLISQMDTLLKKQGYDVMLLITNLQVNLGVHMINVAISNSVDGILLFPYTTNVDPVRQIRRHNIPLVLVDREIEGINADFIRCDDYAGGYLAGTQLFRLGHRRFLYVAGPPKNASQPLRKRGFLQALADNGLNESCVRTISTINVYSIAADHSEIMNLLSPIDYTAVLVFNDQTAYIIVNNLRKANYRVPEDISVVGFDRLRHDIPYLPPLSSIACSSSRNISENAVTFLLNRIKDPSIPSQRKVLPVNFYTDGTTTMAPEPSLNDE